MRDEGIKYNMLEMPTNSNALMATSTEYGYTREFWDLMSGKDADDAKVAKTNDGGFILPYANRVEYKEALKKESLFRNIGTTINLDFKLSRWEYTDDNVITKWNPNANAPILEDVNAIADKYTKLEIKPKRLAGIARLDNDYLNDLGFNIKLHLLGRFARVFGDEEENAFINGDGKEQPVGILNATGGAEIGGTSEFPTCLSWEEVYNLFFSVESKYRKHGSWLMNDATALALRCMKDSSGRFIWNESNNTILGMPVYISNHMPDIGAGAKPIAFGDFSYYCIFDQLLLGVRPLREIFANYGHMGYLGSEMVDGRLVRPEAVKVIKMAE